MFMTATTHRHQPGASLHGSGESMDALQRCFCMPRGRRHAARQIRFMRRWHCMCKHAPHLHHGGDVLVAPDAHDAHDVGRLRARGRRERARGRPSAARGCDGASAEDNAALAAPPQRRLHGQVQSGAALSMRGGRPNAGAVPQGEGPALPTQKNDPTPHREVGYGVVWVVLLHAVHHEAAWGRGEGRQA